MKKTLLCSLLSLSPLLAHAALTELEDGNLSGVQGGEGLGFMLEKFVFDGTAATTTIRDVQKSDGSTLSVDVKNFFIAADDSANGGSRAGAVFNPVNLGRLKYPWRFGVYEGGSSATALETYVEGNYNWGLAPGSAGYFNLKAPSIVKTTPDNKAVLMLAAPRKYGYSGDSGSDGSACVTGASYISANYGSSCTSREANDERPDMGIRFDYNMGGGRVDTLDFRLGRVSLDGSYVRMWADDARGGLVGEALINLYAKTFDVMTCADGGAGCNTAPLRDQASIYMSNVAMNVALGYGKSQPLQFRATDGTSCKIASPSANCGAFGNFVLRLGWLIPSAVNNPADAESATNKPIYTDFYNNAPSTNVRIDNINVGGSRATQYAAPTGGLNLGSSEITGMRFHYLQVKSHDL